jgi:hypothetical protein
MKALATLIEQNITTRQNNLMRGYKETKKAAKI